MADTSQYQIGGWYDGRQWNGQTLGAPGVINLPGQQGYGQPVSNEVVAQTNPANVAYLQQQNQTASANAGLVNPTTGLQQPTINLMDEYNRAYNTPEIQSAVKEFDDKTKAYNEAQAIINDNPFYSEATRVGKARQLTEQYNNEANRLQDKVNKLKADAEVRVNLMMKQYDLNNQAYKDKLDLFNSVLSGGGLSNASSADIANYARITGLSTSVIENMVKEQKRKSTSTGNTTQSRLNQLKADVASGMTVADLASKWIGIYNQNDIMPVYNVLSPYGKAKETPDEINQIFGATKGVPFAQLPSQAQANIKWLRDQISSGLMTREEAIQQVPDAAPYL